MKKQIFVALALAAAGCFGSDPNMNSQYFADAGPTTTGTAGTSGSMNVTGPIVGMPLATYDSNITGFMLDPYHDAIQKNLADPQIIATQPGMMMPTMTFESGMGSPTPGCVRVVAPYTGASQFVQIEAMSFGTSNTKNWTGGKLHMRAQILAGTFTGGAQLYIKTGSDYVFGGTYINFPMGSGWKDFVLNVDAPMTLGTSGMYDPGESITYGVQLNTGSAGANAQAVTFLIDSFSIELPAGGSGTGGGGGGGGTAGTSGTAGAGGTTGSGGAAGSGDASAGN